MLQPLAKAKKIGLENLYTPTERRFSTSLLVQRYSNAKWNIDALFKANLGTALK